MSPAFAVPTPVDALRVASADVMMRESSSAVESVSEPTVAVALILPSDELTAEAWKITSPVVAVSEIVPVVVETAVLIVLVRVPSVRVRAPPVARTTSPVVAATSEVAAESPTMPEAVPSSRTRLTERAATVPTVRVSSSERRMPPVLATAATVPRVVSSEGVAAEPVSPMPTAASRRAVSATKSRLVSPPSMMEPVSAVTVTEPAPAFNPVRVTSLLASRRIFPPAVVATTFAAKVIDPAVASRSRVPVPRTATEAPVLNVSERAASKVTLPLVPVDMAV